MDRELVDEFEEGYDAVIGDGEWALLHQFAGWLHRNGYLSLDADSYDYIVPVKDEGNGVAWKMYAVGDTPEEAQENALDKHERRHGYRPQPHGEPEPVDGDEEVSDDV